MRDIELTERLANARKVRKAKFRRQLLWGFCWAIFCALWQPVLFEMWVVYGPTLGWWIIVPIWLLAGSPSLTFFWFWRGKMSALLFFEMLLLFGPVTSITVGWLFWTGFVAGGYWLSR